MAAGVRLATVDSSACEISSIAKVAWAVRVKVVGVAVRVKVVGEAVRVKVVGVRLVKVVGAPRVMAARVRWSVAYRTTTGPSS